jgi:hypothetical protein
MVRAERKLLFMVPPRTRVARGAPGNGMNMGMPTIPRLVEKHGKVAKVASVQLRLSLNAHCPKDSKTGFAYCEMAKTEGRSYPLSKKLCSRDPEIW